MTISLIGLFFLIFSCQESGSEKNSVLSNYKLLSPNEKIELDFSLTKDGQPSYSIKGYGETLIDPSQLGFIFEEKDSLYGAFKIINTKESETKETYDLPWGETKTINSHSKNLIVSLEEINEPKRQLKIEFRAFNDGIGFRYHFEKQRNDTLKILEERTYFNLAEDHMSWWIPGDWDIYEHLYTKSKVSKIDATVKRNHPALGQTYIPVNAVNTPFTTRTKSGIHMSFHEANLTNYSDMTLQVDTTSHQLFSNLVGSENRKSKVIVRPPFKTPWRTIQITEKATDLVDSKLILNLNEPNQLGSVSYFEPMKYMGIWWDMHLGKATWDKSSGQHGATTANAKRYIDFASKHQIKGLLVEGWNTGWEHWIGFEDREGVFDFVTPYSDYNLNEVVDYGKKKGVQIIMHHETSAAPRTYEQQLDTAFDLMNKYDISSVKTGYVGKIIPKGEYHHGQWMINHYRKVILKAAEKNIAINAHEPIKATGLRRTYPNIISREGLRGQEFNAWSPDGGNPPSHLPTVAFTRMLAGPIDFTPGVFNIKLAPYKNENQINTTIAHQLALYVVLYSPIQMACDLPEHYQGKKAFDFIEKVGVDWSKSKTLLGEVGEYVVVARKEKGTEKWFIGGITNEDDREVKIDFEFLNENQIYDLEIYKDGDQAHWDKNPTDISIEKMTTKKGQSQIIKMAKGGGFAIMIKPQIIQSTHE